MVSTIQISNKVKETLARYKVHRRDSYEDVIVNLILKVEGEKENMEKLMIEGCKEMAEENIKISKDFENSDFENLPEWK